MRQLVRKAIFEHDPRRRESEDELEQPKREPPIDEFSMNLLKYRQQKVRRNAPKLSIFDHRVIDNPKFNKLP